MAVVSVIGEAAEAASEAAIEVDEVEVEVVINRIMDRLRQY